MPIKRYGSGRSGAGGQHLPFAKATQAGGFLFISGQVAMDESGEIVPGGIIPQARKTIENLIKILEECHYTLADVVKVNVWLDDPRDFWTFNKIYAEYFSDHPPARSTVCSSMMVDAKIEMDLVAYQPPH
ncbi:MAG: reactive intermediate/imine deaminase [Coxiella sp. RIFCSPHIGHO2_12_FULL_44_14]|nr:MAG: reactive intermediate/imine deaminase [Coxiella sp. RIFCSPHIGHO2_12_FULL_44_14]